MYRVFILTKFLNFVSIFVELQGVDYQVFINVHGRSRAYEREHLQKF